MLGYLKNSYLQDEKKFEKPGEILFIQKVKELLSKNSGVSYSYKIHNFYSILLELKSVIEDHYHGRTNGFILEDVRKEAMEIASNELVMSAKRPSLFATIKEEIKKSLSVDKNNDYVIKDSDMDKVNGMYASIQNLENVYSRVEYLKDSLNLLREAIEYSRGDEIILLTECVISSNIIIGRSISSSYTSVEYFFEKSEKPFEDCWNQWVSNMLRTKAEYRCYFKVKENYREKIPDVVSGSTIRSRYPEAGNLEMVEDESFYYEAEVQVPANDQYAQVETAFSAYKKEVGIVEFATAKVRMLEDVVIVYDVYFKKFNRLERKRFQVNSEYKPYNQYHKNIDIVVRNLTQDLLSDLDRNKLINAIINVCNFEKEGKEYSFILLWSSLESLFRSNQYPTAISAIKDIIPNILSHRYIYYRLFDFLKDCHNIGIHYSYHGLDMVVENPNEEQICLLFDLLRDDTQNEVFLQECRSIYELLYYRGIELKQILMNAVTMKQKIERHRQVIGYQLQRMYRIRNKFVHHSMIDDNIDVLCKHMKVYMWEAIREMSYIADKRKIRSLEELYSYFRMNHIMMQKMLVNQNSTVEIKHIVVGYL